MSAGAMKPAYIFGISIGVLLAGTLFSRMADGHATRSPVHSGAIAASPRVIRLPTPFATGTAESAVLRQIADSLASHPDSRVSVEWIETSRGRQNRNRATYFPDRQTMRCDRIGYSSFEYNPVTPAAIDRALRDNADAAFFANANLYSMGRVAP